MRTTENITEVAALPIDLMGFIFYPKSPRYIKNFREAIKPIEEALAKSSRNTKRVGVFVNAADEDMTEIAELYKLDYLQLHGNESVSQCRMLQQEGYKVIKAFSVATPNDLEKTEAYENCVDFFLFDTKCAKYGGSGKSFDWSVLHNYRGNVPFILSGGIRPESIDPLNRFTHPKWIGIDLNSGFETEVAIKSQTLLSSFITSFIKNQKEK